MPCSEPGRADGRASRGRRRARLGVRDDGRPSTRGPCRRSARPTPRHENDSESAVCPGVATTWTSRSPTVTTSPSPSPSDPSRYAGSRARTPQPCRSAKARAASVWSGWWWVSSTPTTSWPAAETASRCASIDGPGSITNDCEPERQHPGVGAVEGHHVGVGREHAARRRPEGPARPAHRGDQRAGSARHREHEVLADGHDLGREHVHAPPAAAASTSSAVACCATSRQVR